MTEQPTDVEVLDREGDLVPRDGQSVARSRRRPLPSLWNPLNWFLLVAAIFTAVALLFHAVTELVRHRGRDDG